MEVGILTAEGGLHAHATARNRLQSRFCISGGEGLTRGRERYRRELTLAFRVPMKTPSGSKANERDAVLRGRGDKH